MLLTRGLNAYQNLIEGEFCFELAARCTGVEGGVVTGGLNACLSKLTEGEFSSELAARCAGVEGGVAQWVLNIYQKLTEGEFCYELATRCTGVESSAAHQGIKCLSETY